MLSLTNDNLFMLIKGFTKSLAMTVLSEIGDKTFVAAAVSKLFNFSSLPFFFVFGNDFGWIYGFFLITVN